MRRRGRESGPSFFGNPAIRPPWPDPWLCVPRSLVVCLYRKEAQDLVGLCKSHATMKKTSGSLRPHAVASLVRPCKGAAWRLVGNPRHRCPEVRFGSYVHGGKEDGPRRGVRLRAKRCPGLEELGGFSTIRGRRGGQGKRGGRVAAAAAQPVLQRSGQASEGKWFAGALQGLGLEVFSSNRTASRVLQERTFTQCGW